MILSYMLFIICGLQGTGKSTVAEKISAKVNGVIIKTDVIRGELFKVPAYSRKIYSQKQMQQVYDEMFLRTKKIIEKGENVILDATFTKKENRNKAKAISEKFKLIETICPEHIVKERMVKRFDDSSKAKFEHYLKYKKFFEPIDERHIVIDTSKDIDKQIRQFSEN